jgi:hypothetical protein
VPLFDVLPNLGGCVANSNDAEQDAKETEPSDLTLSESRPRWRLHHFFALTAVAAILLAIHGPQPDYWAGTDVKPPKLMLMLMTAWTVVYVLLISVAVTAVAYGVIWHRKGLLFFDQPGHWLLVEIGIIGLFGLVPAVVYRWLIADMDITNDDFAMAAMLFTGFYSLFVAIIIPIALNIYIGLKKCREARWSVVFYIKAPANLLFGLGSVAVIIALLIVANRDRRENVRRDSSHWCGVWLQLAYSSASFLIAIMTIVNMMYMMSRM